MSKNNLVVEREKLAFTMSRVFDAPRELVWKCFTELEHMKQWWGPKGFKVNEVEEWLKKNTCPAGE